MEVWHTIGLLTLLALGWWRAVREEAEARRARVWAVGGATRCPFCHGAVSEAPLLSCLTCHTEQHAECWAEHGGCSVHGCGSDRLDVGRLPVHEVFAGALEVPVSAGATSVG